MLIALVLIFVACGGNDMLASEGQTQGSSNQADISQQTEVPLVPQSANQAMDISRYFTIVEGHRLEPGMSWNEVMSLGFEPIQGIEELDYNRRNSRVAVGVNYTPNISNPEVAILNETDVMLIFTTPGSLDNMASAAEGYLSGVIIARPLGERWAEGEYVRANMNVEMYAGVNLSHTLEDIVDLWGEYSRMIEAMGLAVMYYESSNTEIRLQQRTERDSVHFISWEVRQAVLRSLGIDLDR